MGINNAILSVLKIMVMIKIKKKKMGKMENKMEKRKFYYSMRRNVYVSWRMGVGYWKYKMIELFRLEGILIVLVMGK